MHKERQVDTMNGHETKIMKLNNELLQNIKKHLPELKELLKSVNDHTYGDMVYRFYHASLKVYSVQGITEKIVKALNGLAPEGTEFIPAWIDEAPKDPVTFNFQFEEIFQKGTGKTFNIKHNEKWGEHTRPMLEAFFHAKYFLEMAVKYGKELEEAPTYLPCGWAALLYYYNLR
jgi:hypothetical protein